MSGLREARAMAVLAIVSGADGHSPPTAVRSAAPRRRRRHTAHPLARIDTVSAGNVEIGPYPKRVTAALARIIHERRRLLHASPAEDSAEAGNF
jgi:hypothetical protein